MEANSDSALVALGMLDSLSENNPKMSKAQQMRFDLMQAINGFSIGIMHREAVW